MFKPIRITVAGRNMAEVKAFMLEFLAELNGDSTEASVISQAPEVHIPAPMPAFNFKPGVSPEAFHNPIIAEIPMKSAPVAANNEFGVDSRGLPWDARIHAVTQGVNRDGSWRNRRGVEDATLAAVETELRQKMSSAPVALPQVQVVPPVQPISAPNPFGNQAPVMLHPVAPPTVPIPAQVPEPVHQIQPQSAPVVAPPPTPIPMPLPSAHTFQTFKEHLVPTLGKLVTDGKLTQDYVNQLKAHFKVDQIWQLNEIQLQTMFDQFTQLGLIAEV